MANSPPLSTVLKAVVNSDPELAEAARALASKAIALANHYLDNGSPKVQMEVIKSIMPAIGRGMTERGEAEEIGEMRAQLDQIMQLVTGDGESDVA